MRLQGKTKLFLEWPIGGPERANAGLRLFFFEASKVKWRSIVKQFQISLSNMLYVRRADPIYFMFPRLPVCTIPFHDFFSIGSRSCVCHF